MNFQEGDKVQGFAGMSLPSSAAAKSSNKLNSQLFFSPEEIKSGNLQ